mmetsp:Transcript_11559/g.24331  ORF Transcript_11559/g.24331 Transcript_11559/m.24331 type:complete len:231 (-) Transcript_11559:1000-1692(-)
MGKHPESRIRFSTEKPDDPNEQIHCEDPPGVEVQPIATEEDYPVQYPAEAAEAAATFQRAPMGNAYVPFLHRSLGTRLLGGEDLCVPGEKVQHAEFGHHDRAAGQHEHHEILEPSCFADGRQRSLERIALVNEHEHRKEPERYPCRRSSRVHPESCVAHDIEEDRGSHIGLYLACRFSLEGEFDPDLAWRSTVGAVRNPSCRDSFTQDPLLEWCESPFRVLQVRQSKSAF